MGRMILEIAAAMGFNRSKLDPINKPVYLMAFVDGARFVQATNRKARELSNERKLISALGIAGGTPQAKPRSKAGKPDPKGNAQKKKQRS